MTRYKLELKIQMMGRLDIVNDYNLHENMFTDDLSFM